MSFTTTVILGSTSSLATPTLSLPPQITPFTPPTTVNCTPSVYCPYLTYWLYNTGADLSGMSCEAAYTMDELAGLYLGYKEPCFPEGYATLFDNNSKFDHATPPPPELATVAYPGTACLSDWTTACTSLVTYGTESYPQAWCCPSGSWQCATDSGRWCASVMTESTTIWMTWDPAFTDQSSNEWYTWTADIGSAPSESAPTVYRHVFPLYLMTDGGGGMTSDNDSTPHNESPPENVSPPDNNSYCNDPDDRCPDGSESGFALNTGVKAGIGVAAGAVVLGISMGLLFIIRRRQKGRGGAGEATISEDNSPPAPTEPGFGDKPELEGSTIAEARGVVPEAELDAGDGERSGPAQNESNRVGSESQAGTVSPLGTLSPEPTGSDGIFPSPESRHKSVFEMPA